MKGNISASTESNDLIRQSSDCLQYINNTESLLKYLLDNLNLTVFECLQTETCTLSCQGYKKEFDDLNQKIDEYIKEVKEKQDSTVNQQQLLNNRDSLMHNFRQGCESFDESKCKEVYEEFREQNERTISKEALANSKNPNLVYASDSGNATVAFLRQGTNVDAFLDQATLAPTEWTVYCCKEGIDDHEFLSKIFDLDGKIQETSCGNGKSCSDVCGNISEASMQNERNCLTVIFEDENPKEQAENICKALISQDPQEYCFKLPNNTVFTLQEEYNRRYCSENFTYFPHTDMCYTYVDQLKTWDEAENYCATLVIFLNPNFQSQQRLNN